MPEDAADRSVCQICHEAKPADEVLPARMVPGAVAEIIRKEHPEWSDEGYVCVSDLNHYRMERVRRLVTEEMGGLTEVETEVVQSLADQDILSRNTNVEFEGARTYGERVSDRIASFGGSWPFIFTFGGVLVAWIAVNTVGLLRPPFDPYPYILLNLVLSCLAAVQAPIIMMSQNRQEARDRLRSEHDYQVNLKAELEIRSLSARIDELLRHQWHGLLEIQQVQTEMMEELARKTASTSNR
jgi:uncharacterized membrane protein